MVNKIPQERELLKTQIAGYPKVMQETVLEVFDKLRLFSPDYTITPCAKYDVDGEYFSMYVTHPYGGISRSALMIFDSIHSARFIGVRVEHNKLSFMFYKGVF